MIAEYDVNNTLLRKFIYGPGIDEPIVMIDVANSKTYYYHFDGLGSVIALTDTSGTFVEYYEYDVFGEPTIWDANAQEIVESSVVGNPYMFTGRRYDTETGLYYYRARYYDPYIGRFLQTDPIAMFLQLVSTQRPRSGKIPGTYLSVQAAERFLRNDPIGRFLRVDPSGRFLLTHLYGFPAELNLYTYVGNNPIIFIDPYGLGFWGDLWKTKGWIGGFVLVPVGGLLFTAGLPVTGLVVGGIGLGLVAVEAYEYFTHPPGGDMIKNYKDFIEDEMDDDGDDGGGDDGGGEGEKDC